MVRLIKVFFLVMLIASPIYAEIDILPLGDSITAATKTKSYRYHLWNLLIDEGYNINFIGTQRHQNYNNFDPDHEGHGGWRADQIAAALSSWLKGYSPDIVLLHIGHNDLWQKGSFNIPIDELINSTINDIDKIITILQADNPNVTILLAQIIYPNWPQTKFTQLNKQIPSLARRKTTAHSLVIPVNHNETFNPAEDTYDDAHPNDSGDQKMAQQWYKSIVPVLSRFSKPINNLLPPQDFRIISASYGQ